MSVDPYALLTQIVEAKVQDPSADIRQTVFEAVKANESIPAMLVDTLNILDALGSFIGLHYARVTTDPAPLMRLILDDVRFLGIVTGEREQ